MSKLFFGNGIFQAKKINTLSSTSGQGYKSSPVASTLYTATYVSGLISNRNGSAESYPYGVEIESQPVGRPISTYNANGLQLHPIICLSTTKSTTVYERYLAGGPAGSTVLNIYSGTKPQSTASLSSLTSVSSNLLLSFSIGAGVSGMKFLTHQMHLSDAMRLNNTYRDPGVVSVQLGICQNKTLATGTGTASWFWFGNSSSPSDLSDISFVIGDIGSINDPSVDLYMQNPKIEAGKYYISSGFKFTFPSEITV